MKTGQLRSKTIGIVGAGVMGSILAVGAAQIPHTRVLVSDPSHQKCRALARFGVKRTSDNITLAKSADVIVFAVKPLMVKEVLAELHGHITHRHLVISIAAGAPLRHFAQLKSKKLMRAMPNTPGRIGAGITGLYGSKACTKNDWSLAHALFSALGMVMRLKSEDEIDKITALTGCGPGFMFAILEGYEAAARSLGFSKAVAKDIALQTMFGAALLADSSSEDFSALRAQVATPGGTTEAGLKILMKHLNPLLEKTVKAAYKMAQELGK